jgi:lipopolysaccharide/colanic/teichoic acid biosynthesis glycosyltransferase
VLGAVGLDMLRCPRDRGRVFYRERRISRGRPFDLLKLRTLRESVLVEAEGHVRPFEADAKNLTWAGRRVLKPLYLDELPQLVNVLRGEMSLVGPRPLVPEEDSMIVGHYRRRLDIAPGITGYWQALGSYRIPLSEMVRLDYLYVETWSLWNDVRILLRTIPYVVGRQGR